MPFANRHSCDLGEVGEGDDVFQEDTTRSDKEAKNVIAVDDDGNGRRVGIRYPTSSWSESEARADCDRAGGTFEAATGGDDDD